MKPIALAFAVGAATMSLPAQAQAQACPELDALARRIGITFAGFTRPIPVATGPDGSGTGRMLQLRLPAPSFVSDGFRHKVLFNTASRKLWILRTGGLAGVREWYGPVDAGDDRLENCQDQPEPGQERVLELKMWP